MPFFSCFSPKKSTTCAKPARGLPNPFITVLRPTLRNALQVSYVNGHNSLTVCSWKARDLRYGMSNLSILCPISKSYFFNSPRTSMSSACYSLSITPNWSSGSNWYESSRKVLVLCVDNGLIHTTISTPAPTAARSVVSTSNTAALIFISSNYGLTLPYFR